MQASPVQWEWAWARWPSVRRGLPLRGEALPAAARGPVVRVAHDEPAPRDALRVVHARAVEVGGAVRVHDDLDPVRLEDLVPLVELVVEGHPVPEPGASAACDVDPEVRVFGEIG